MATAGTAEAMATEMEVATATVEETATVKAKANSARLAAIARGLSNRRRCLAVWPYAMALIVALVGPSAYAQQDRAVPGRSLEAALKAYCPGKNLEFLEQQVLDRAIGFSSRAGFGPARDHRRATRGSTACNGASDGSCRSAVTLGVLRQRNLSHALARRMCELPYRCSDSLACVAERSAPTPPQPERGRPCLGGAGTAHGGAAANRQTAARCPNPPRRRSWLLRCARARRWSGRGSVHHSRKARTRPILGEAMQRFYSGLREPLALQDIAAEDEDTFQILHTGSAGPTDLRAMAARSCSQFRELDTWGFLVESIRALTGC